MSWVHILRQLTSPTCQSRWRRYSKEPPPPPPSTPLLSIQRPQRGISVTVSIWKLWVCKLILDCDGDHFLFHQFFVGRLSFCMRQCFVHANNLLTPKFLCAPMFLYILPPPIFCVFCQRLNKTVYDWLLFALYACFWKQTFFEEGLQIKGIWWDFKTSCNFKSDKWDQYCSAQTRTGIGLLGKPPAVKQFPSFKSH